MKKLVLNGVIAAASLVPSFSGATIVLGHDRGRGFVLPAEQVSKDDLISQVSRSLIPVRAWLNSRFIQYRKFQEANECTLPQYSEDCELNALLFDRRTSVFEVLENVEIQTRVGSPCLDSSGAAVDGSVFGSKKNSICISIDDIQTKVREDNSENQIISLVMHEISHLVGANEREAVALQKTMLEWHLSIEPASKLRVTSVLVEILLSDLAHDLNAFSDEYPKISDTSLGCSKAETLSTQLADYYDHDVKLIHFKFMTVSEARKFLAVSSELTSIRHSICSAGALPKNDRVSKRLRKLAKSLSVLDKVYAANWKRNFKTYTN